MIGIIGRGFVGSAVQFGFSPNVGFDEKIRIYDKDPSKSIHTLEDVVNKSKIVFISIPTPSYINGEINLELIDNCLNDINNVSNNQAIFLIRSTVIPGTTRKLSEKYPSLKLVFNPEFLTERSAKLDFINQSRVILGGNLYEVNKVADLYIRRFGKSLPIIRTNYESAELIKYMTNTFLATKISFLNEMKILSEKSGSIWEDVIDGFIRDGRIGNSHLNIPGPDGKLGFGGSCFPKDIQAIIHYADKLGINMSVLKGAWETNLKIRPERDWENLEGRAITKK